MFLREVFIYFPPSPIRGRGEARRPMRPIAACAMVVEERTRVSQVTPESPGTPRAVVYGLYVLSPAIRPWVVTVIGGVLTADLTPALRRQDHTLSLVRLGAVRPTAPPRPPHPRPASMTLRNAPLSGTGWQIICLICISEKQKYFCWRGWTVPANHGMGRTDLPDRGDKNSS
jgi:hypothetical protein